MSAGSISNSNDRNWRSGLQLAAAKPTQSDPKLTSRPPHEMSAFRGRADVANHDAIRPPRRRAAGSKPAMAMPGDVAAFVSPRRSCRRAPVEICHVHVPHLETAGTIPPSQRGPHRTPSARAVPYTRQLVRWPLRIKRYHDFQNLQRISRRITTLSSSPSSERLRASLDSSPTTHLLAQALCGRRAKTFRSCLVD